MPALRQEWELEDAVEAEIDRAIAERGGDARETIRDLLITNAYLEAERDRALDLASAGFVRRALKQRAG